MAVPLPALESDCLGYNSRSSSYRLAQLWMRWGPWSDLTTLSKVNTAFEGRCWCCCGGSQVHTSSSLVLTSLLLPSVLWSRQIRGSGKTAGIQSEDQSFPASCERAEKGFRFDMGERSTPEVTQALLDGLVQVSPSQHRGERQCPEKRALQSDSQDYRERSQWAGLWRSHN